MSIEITMPKLGFDMQEGKLVRWLKHEGDSVKTGEPIVEIETDKALIEVESFSNGVVSRLMVEPGQVAQVGAVIALLEGGPESKEKVPESPVDYSRPNQGHEKETPLGKKNETLLVAAFPIATDEKVKISPLARRIAREQSIQLTGLQGTGPGGMIVKKDLLSVKVAPGEEQKATQAVPLPPVKVAAPEPDNQRVPLNRMRQIIARRMSQSNAEIPQFTVSISIWMDKALDLRSQFNAIHPEQPLSINDLIVRAAALVLRKFPRLNSSFLGSELEYHKHINISIAVALEDGLMTTVLRDTDQKSLSLISQEAKALIQRAREGKIRPDDIESSTFTISNLGMYGVDDFCAIVNPPEAAILAVGAIQIQPSFVDGIWKPLSVGKFNLSVDHRVSDGVEGAQYLGELKKYLEEPIRLI